MLSVAIALHVMSTILVLVHLWRYSVNGWGIPLFETLSEGKEKLELYAFFIFFPHFNSLSIVPVTCSVPFPLQCETLLNG